MIIGALLDLVQMLIFNILGFINLPAFPDALTSAINGFVDLIFNNLGLIDFFVPWGTIKICVPLVIAIANLDHIYDAIMWILRKIPMLGMS